MRTRCSATQSKHSRPPDLSTRAKSLGVRRVQSAGCERTGYRALSRLRLIQLKPALRADRSFGANTTHHSPPKLITKNDSKLSRNQNEACQLFFHLVGLWYSRGNVVYLASSLPLPPKAVRSALQLFDSGLLAAATPHLVPQAAADDPFIKRRLRLPARLAGGALRERGGWLADD